MRRAAIGMVLALAAGAAVGCGGGGEKDAPARDITVAVTQLGDGGPSRSAAKKWPAAWCGVSVGATRSDLRAAMGKPTSTFEDQDAWEGFGLTLTAFYDTTLHAHQLAVSSGKVPCSANRKE